MNRIALALLATTLSITPALAADLRRPVTKVQPQAAPVYNWTGCYMMGGGGYGMWTQDTSAVFDAIPSLNGAEIRSGGRGWFGTVGGGCDFQINDRWVVGVYGDYDFASIKGTLLDGEHAFSIFGSEKLRSAWFVGGRVGYLIAPSVLTYLSGGFTEARFTGAKLLFSSVPPQATDVHVLGHTYSGWFLGSGFEYNLGWLPGLFWRTEYRYAQYDKGSLPFLLNSSGAPTGGRLDSEKFVQTIRSELVWRWNLDGPARTSPAMAVDLPRKAPPAPLVYNWTGCYMMGGGGYGMWTQDTSTFFDPDPSQVGSEVRTGGRGWFGTVGGGCDLQINDRWVVGAYGDYDFASIKGNIFASEAGAAKIGSEKLRSAWFVGGRIGYLIAPSVLTYFSGGFTEARFTGAELFFSSVPLEDTNTHVLGQTYSGWFLGSGLEYNLAWLPGLFWRTEYRYAQYDNESLIVFSTPAGTPTGRRLDSEKFVQTIRTELVWKLNWGGPVAARY